MRFAGLLVLAALTAWASTAVFAEGESPDAQAKALDDRILAAHAIALTLMYTHPGKYPITSSMRRAESFMQSLARIGGGSYKHVANPPK